MSVLLDKLNYAILLLFFAASTLGIIMGGSALYDGTTYLYNVAIIGALALCYWFSSYKNSAILQFTIIQFYIFILPRFLVYALKPDMVVFPGGIDFTLAEINQGLCPLSLCLVLFFLGIAATTFYPNKIIPEKPNRSIPPAAVMILFIIFASLVLFQNQIFSRPDVSFFTLGINEKSQLHIIFKILTTVLSADVILFIILYAYLSSAGDQQSSNRWKWAILLCAWLGSALFVLDASLLGSRGSGIRIVQFAVSLFLVLQNQNKKIFLHAALLSAFAIIFNLAMFGTANVNRVVMSGKISTIKGLNEAKIKNKSPDEIIENIKKKAEKENSAIGSLGHLMNRLGTLDYFLITLSRTPEPNCQEKYLNLQYAARNTINFLMPGDPYEAERLNTSNVFGLCYGGKKIETMERRTSEIWTWFGVSKWVFPTFNYLIVFLGGLLMGAGALLLKGGQSHYMKIAYSFYIFIAPSLVLFSMGLDHTANTTITFILRLGISLIGLAILLQLLSYKSKLFAKS